MFLSSDCKSFVPKDYVLKQNSSKNITVYSYLTLKK